MSLNKTYLYSYLVYFFLIYGITLNISGMIISPMKMILLSTLILFLVSNLKHFKTDIILFKYGFIVMLYLLYVLLYLYPFGLYQDYLVRNGTVLFFLVFISSIYLAKNFFIKLSEVDFLRIVFFATVFYSIIIVLMVLSDTLKDIIYSVVTINEGFLTTGGENRITAPNALWGASFSTILLMGMISGIVISKSLNSFIYYSSLVIILIAIANIGRSGLFLFIVLLPVILITNNINKKHKFIKIFIYLFALSVLGSLILIVLYENINQLENISSAVSRIKRSLIPIIEGGIFNDPTISLLLENYYFLPKSDDVLWYGSGASGRNEADTGFILSSDVGYVRMIFTVGLLGSLVLYSLYFIILIKSLLNLRYSPLMKYTFLISLIMFLFHFKEVSMSNVYMSYMLFIPYFLFLYKKRESKKESIC